MTKKFPLVLAVFCLLLNSCSHNQAEIKAAAAACRQPRIDRYIVCDNTCHNSCAECLASVSNSSTISYLNYVNEQFIKHGVIARDLNSYRDPLQCRKVTCACQADYNVCIQGCGGVIHKRLQVVPVCQ